MSRELFVGQPRIHDVAADLKPLIDVRMPLGVGYILLVVEHHEAAGNIGVALATSSSQKEGIAEVLKLTAGAVLDGDMPLRLVGRPT